MVLLGLHLLLMTPVFAFQYLFVIESQRLFWSVVVTGSLGLMILLQLRRWGNEKFVCHIGCAMLTLLPRVQADENGLAQILLNLLVNAAQSIEPGDSQGNIITVAAGFEEGNLIIEVRDSGEGMSEETKGRIFEAFYTTKGATEGTGLGLAICQTIARSMGGGIEVESVLGKGTTMRLVWPGLMAKTEVLV